VVKVESQICFLEASLLKQCDLGTDLALLIRNPGLQVLEMTTY